jgi:hypothetical protein
MVRSTARRDWVLMGTGLREALVWHVTSWLHREPVVKRILRNNKNDIRV